MRRRWRWLAPAAAVLWYCAGAMASDVKWLITPEEAAHVRTPSGSVVQALAAKEGPGPAIIVKNPKALQNVVSPVDIVVKFEPGKSGEPPDMGTLNVLVIGFFNFDITDRVREYIKASSLEIEKADLPTGSHQLRIAIKDIAGNPNERDAVVNVAEK